jgi:hypothetical protein
LIGAHRVGEFCEGGQQGQDEAERRGGEAAIRIFGLPAIADDLIKTFEWAQFAVVLKEEMEGKELARGKCD